MVHWTLWKREKGETFYHDTYVSPFGIWIKIGHLSECELKHISMLRIGMDYRIENIEETVHVFKDMRKWLPF